MWLRKGRTAQQGDPKRVVDGYLIHVAGGEEALMQREHGQTPSDAALAAAPPIAPAAATAAEPKQYREGRWGNREIEIREIQLVDSGGRQRHLFASGEPMTVVMKAHAKDPVDDFVFGIGLFTADGVSVYGTNTDIEGFEPEQLRGDAEVRFEVSGLRLVEGTYLLDVAAHRKDGTPYDYHRGLYSFRVKSRVKDVGVYRPEHTWSFSGGATLLPPEPRGELDLKEES
jgi:hypothetical protein